MASEKEKMQIQFEKKIQCLCQQLMEYTNQIDLLQDDIDRQRARISSCTRETEELKRQLSQRDDAIACYESKLEDLKFELKEKEKNSQRVLDCLQDKIAVYQDQLQQRESTLVMCRSDVKSQEASMEEARSEFICELQQKQGSILQLKDELRRVYDDLKCKSESGCQLERSISDIKTRLHQVSCQVKEAESKISCLLEQMQQMECQNNRDKCQSIKDIEEFERKLAQSCNDLCACQNDNRKLRRCLQDKDEEIQSLTSEVTSMSRELQSEKMETCGHQERAAALENDNKEICRLLQQKVKCIKELENTLCIKEEDLEQCRCCVEQLKAAIRRLTVTDEKEDTSDMETQLKNCREKLKQLEIQIEECRKKLEWAIQEMENMATEIKRLNCELDEANRQINEKTSLIGDLERTIEHAEQDMESRIRRADEQLQKYEREIKDKTHMVAECEEKCCRYQNSLSDKETELEQVEQRLCRSTCEITSLCSKINELEDTRDLLQKKSNEQRAQYSELCQDYKCNREQLEIVAADCNDSKRDLACFQRDLEKFRREAEDLRLDMQEKDSAVCRLTDEKNCLANKVAALQCRLETETTQLTQQLTEVRYRLESDMEKIRSCQMEADETNATLSQKLSTGQRQLAQLEKCYYQKVDALTRENQSLQAKTADKDDQLQAIKDAITLRDSEIMRLKLRLCSADRCSNNQKSAIEYCSQTGGQCAAQGTSTTGKGRRRSVSCGEGRPCTYE